MYTCVISARTHISDLMRNITFWDITLQNTSICIYKYMTSTLYASYSSSTWWFTEVVCAMCFCFTFQCDTLFSYIAEVLPVTTNTIHHHHTPDADSCLRDIFVNASRVRRGAGALTASYLAANHFSPRNTAGHQLVNKIDGVPPRVVHSSWANHGWYIRN